MNRESFKATKSPTCFHHHYSAAVRSFHQQESLLSHKREAGRATEESAKKRTSSFQLRLGRFFSRERACGGSRERERERRGALSVSGSRGLTASCARPAQQPLGFATHDLAGYQRALLNMNPMCSRCNRVVYPVEKLNCLDKYWHKACFSCEVCQMTLNMKTYKGYEKKPYCNAHYPSTKFTVVADTPENIRLKQQSEQQSHVAYKQDFEKNKGKGYSVVIDTPELERLKKTQQQISDVRYHEGEKTKYAYAPQADQPASAPPQNYYHEQPSRVQERAPERAPEPAAPAGKRYRALYDYAAADDDEVSFMDGDVIVGAQQIDEGWMHGCVERTGQVGMLPSNYVELI
ncbi:hypothetical protein WMY93_018693 [Mugilogobius chulae]|uniref:LIM and SH3 domain protein 1 n=1 Tax=Mugilogobius chulae TaxID=88201 RepID=A0AAW0NNX6_9GOBI